MVPGVGYARLNNIPGFVTSTSLGVSSLTQKRQRPGREGEVAGKGNAWDEGGARRKRKRGAGEEVDTIWAEFGAIF